MKYIVKNLIGEGACGKVYKGIDSNNNLVSIKFVQKNKKSQNEIKILSSLDHENVLKFIDFYETSSNLCLVTELCEYNLITFINEYNVDIDISKKIIRMILCGLEYLHSRNIIHRDIKLANILIQNNSIKICDFGLSCYENKNKYSVCGTEDYVAPEIVNKLSYTKNVDIYSAGKLFMTLLGLKNEVDLDCNDLLSKMTEANPLNRITAYEALRHPVFDGFLPKYCDFRYLRDFKIKEKFGNIEKKGDSVSFDDCKVTIVQLIHANISKGLFLDIVESKKDNIFDISNIINITNNENSKFEYIFYYKEIEKEIFLFTNSQLKKIIYGMAYLNLKLERLPIVIIEDFLFKFTYQLNDGFVYCESNFILKKKFDKTQKIYYYETTDIQTKKKYKSDIILDTDKRKNILKLYQKCKRNLINVDHKNLPLLIKTTTTNNNNFLKNYPTTSSFDTWSSVDSFMDMKLNVANIYRHKPEIGWCIKKNNLFLFLLNNGRYFEIELLGMFVIFQNDKFSINNDIPLVLKKYLKSIRALLIMYL